VLSRERHPDDLGLRLWRRNLHVRLFRAIPAVRVLTKRIKCQESHLQVVQCGRSLQSQMITPSLILRHHVKVAVIRRRLARMGGRVEILKIISARASHMRDDPRSQLLVPAGGLTNIPTQRIKLAIAVSGHAETAPIGSTEDETEMLHDVFDTASLWTYLCWQWKVVLALRHVLHEFTHGDHVVVVCVYNIEQMGNVVARHGQELGQTADALELPSVEHVVAVGVEGNKLRDDVVVHFS